MCGIQLQFGSTKWEVWIFEGLFDVNGDGASNSVMSFWLKQTLSDSSFSVLSVRETGKRVNEGEKTVERSL